MHLDMYGANTTQCAFAFCLFKAVLIQILNFVQEVCRRTLPGYSSNCIVTQRTWSLFNEGSWSRSFGLTLEVAPVLLVHRTSWIHARLKWAEISEFNLCCACQSQCYTAMHQF